MTQPPVCPPSPCSSCPYRRDTPPGIWAPEEYLKLPEYDADGLALAPFRCHHETATGIPTLCRGWLATHGYESIAVRLAVARGLIDPERVEEPIPVEVYASGREACAAGLRGVRRPGRAAIEAMDKLEAARARRKEASDAPA